MLVIVVLGRNDHDLVQGKISKVGSLSRFKRIWRLNLNELLRWDSPTLRGAKKATQKRFSAQCYNNIRSNCKFNLDWVGQDVFQPLEKEAW